ARGMVEGHCSNDFRDQGRTSRGRLRGCCRAVRRATGPVLPTRHAKPRRITKQGGRDLNRTLKLGHFVFQRRAALGGKGPLGLAMAQVNCERSLLGHDGLIAILALAASIAKNLRPPPALRSSKPRPQVIAW